MGISKFFEKKKNTKAIEFISADERSKLLSMDRFKDTQTILFGNTFKIVDAPTFLSSLDEIFGREIYKLNATGDKPVMIDCGANIGLATLYFKKRFPGAKVIAFEPDPNIFKALKANIENQKLTDVSLRKEAIADKEEDFSFYMEGGHSGMIVRQQDSEKIVQVKSARLKEVMKQFEEIAFLKIDIEGYEKYVIPDIAGELSRVKNLFFEYHSFIKDTQIFDELLAVIRKAGMKYYIKESAHKRFPFVDRELFLNMDLILNVFCYRE